MPALTPTRTDALASIALNVAEFLEEIVADDFDGGCDWPADTAACSRLCDDHGCAKARAQECRAALSIAKEDDR